MMKKIIALLLVLVMVFALAACGGTETPDDTKKPSGGNSTSGKQEDTQSTPTQGSDETEASDTGNTPSGGTTYNPPDFGEVNLDNYNEVMKTYFGLDISTFDKWEVRYALTDTETIGNNLKAKRINLQGRYKDAAPYSELKTLFEKARTVSNGTVWARKYQFGKSISWCKGDAYTVFEDYALFYDDTLVPTREGVSLCWLYDYNGHTIFINLDMGSGSFKLLAYFLN